MPVGVGEADGAATGTVDEPVGLGEADEVAEEVGLGVAVVLGVEVVVVGEADGEDVEVAVADGEVEGVVDEVAGAAGPPWAGATRFGVCTCWWPVNSRTTAAIATPSTATAPPVATPAANARRSRRYSVARRSRSLAGRAARRAAQLLTGAAAKPSVGNSSSAASSGPLSWFALVSAPAMAAKPSSASVDSAQLARSASHHLAFSLVFGVRRNAAFWRTGRAPTRAPPPARWTAR